MGYLQCIDGSIVMNIKYFIYLTRFFMDRQIVRQAGRLGGWLSGWLRISR
jgi:hypothetical protein